MLISMSEAIDLLTITYNTPNSIDPPSAEEFPLEYLEQHHPTDAHPRLFKNDDVRRKLSQRRFQKDGPFLPGILEVREERKGSRGTADRIVVLGEDKLHYKVFSLSGGTHKGIKIDDEMGDEDISMS